MFNAIELQMFTNGWAKVAAANRTAPTKRGLKALAKDALIEGGLSHLMANFDSKKFVVSTLRDEVIQQIIAADGTLNGQAYPMQSVEAVPDTPEIKLKAPARSVQRYSLVEKLRMAAEFHHLVMLRPKALNSYELRNRLAVQAQNMCIEESKRLYQEASSEALRTVLANYTSNNEDLVIAELERLYPSHAATVVATPNKDVTAVESVASELHEAESVETVAVEAKAFSEPIVELETESESETHPQSTDVSIIETPLTETPLTETRVQAMIEQAVQPLLNRIRELTRDTDRNTVIDVPGVKPKAIKPSKHVFVSDLPDSQIDLLASLLSGKGLEDLVTLVYCRDNLQRTVENYARNHERQHLLDSVIIVGPTKAPKKAELRANRDKNEYNFYGHKSAFFTIPNPLKQWPDSLLRILDKLPEQIHTAR